MIAQELLKEIIEDTITIINALEVKKLEIALEILSKRKEHIDQFVRLEDKDETLLKDLLEEFKMLNDSCMKAMNDLKSYHKDELNVTKNKKNQVHFANKVNQQYKMVESFKVGNRFDSKRKYKEK